MTTRQNKNTLTESNAAKKLIPFFAALFIVVVFESCEGYRCADGIVFDKVTNLPLDSVLVEVITADSRTLYTDSMGKFDVCNRMRGCVPNCKDIMVRFSKSNYQSIILTNPEKDVIVMMEH